MVGRGKWGFFSADGGRVSEWVSGYGEGFEEPMNKVVGDGA